MIVRRGLRQQLCIPSKWRCFSTNTSFQKAYAGLSKEEVERTLREQGIAPSRGEKRKVKTSKWVNPIFNKPLERELRKPEPMGSDVQRKLELAVKILARPFLEEQKTEEYRQELGMKKPEKLRSLESKIQEEQSLKAQKLKREKIAYASDRDSSVFIRIYPAKLLPNDEHEAILFQKELIRTLLSMGVEQQEDSNFDLKYRHAIRLKGWKVGATQPKAQSTNGLEKPFLGPIFHHQVYRQKDDNDIIPLRNTMIGQLAPRAECEFAFVFKNPLPAREPGSEPYTREQVAEAIGEVIPAMELVGSRVEDVGDQSKEFFLRMADCGSHVALLLSHSTLKDPSIQDLESLCFSKVEFTMNEDEEVINGQGNYVYNGQVHKGSTVGPLDTATWAVNEITAPESESGRGMSVEVGTVISSGTMTGKSRPIDYGDRLDAKFTEVPGFSGRHVLTAEF